MRGRTDIMDLCKRNRVGVEMCPVSNIQTKAIDDFRNYPFPEFFTNNLMISINTDNRTVSNTTCAKEWEMISQIYNFSDVDIA